MQLILGIIRWLNIGTATAACVVMLLMMAHITIDVGVRYFVNGQIVGTLEWVSFYYMVALVFFALGFVEYRNENIRVDLFAQMMPKSVQLGLYIFACVLGLVFFGMLFWQSLHDAIRATGRGEEAMSNFRFYIWPARWALPIGFAGVLLAVLANLLRAIVRRQPL
ncbi:C4-dicarboxylate ABC transporter permease [Pacificitalea manganoxidans]|uniref:TRAP transporter small permease protein n=1 Tax=Pacificitalea manganoxidans TaxID=1411902 RepID=A0A291LX61_9RHOB|nr:TRAP transporter small permease [Pacificitalea manganoxidans]ATI41282.1 C4-dicarboxylate ABC transporter permease [Pacificitalea manganoxidans]MDR6308676.1 TRAP-type C4-dicarboxylate transport system permease small subunit [Pacificitalea manganoxidans]